MTSILLTIAALCGEGAGPAAQPCQNTLIKCVRDKVMQSPGRGKADDFLWECVIETRHI